MNQKNIRLIAFDLDGTLLTEKKVLTPRTRDILEKAADAGVILLTTTGRSLSGIPDAVKVLSGAHYALTANGAGVYRRKDEPGWTELPQDGMPSFDLDSDHAYELLFDHLMDTDLTRRLMSELSEIQVMPDPFIDGKCYMIADKSYLIDDMDVTDAMKDYIRSSRTLVDDMQAFLSDKRVQKITVNFASRNHHRIDLNKAVAIIEKYPEFVAVTGGIRNIEVSDRRATKGDSMMELAGSLGISAEEIVAFGDSENDITMLRAAGIGVAMDNSLDITKDAADEITLSNDEEGVVSVEIESEDGDNRAANRSGRLPTQEQPKQAVQQSEPDVIEFTPNSDPNCITSMFQSILDKYNQEKDAEYQTKKNLRIGKETSNVGLH